MGILISRFRKKKNTTELLEEIEKEIRSIEIFHKETEQQSRRVIGKLIISSIIVYVIALCGYYYYFSPCTFRENFLKFIPLLVFPVAIFLSRRVLSWYYKRKLKKNEVSLKNLKSSKKKILEEVMDKETFKVAKDILEKYAPEQLSLNSSAKMSNIFKSKIDTYPTSAQTIARQRTISSNVTPRQQTNGSSTPTLVPQTAPPRQRAFPGAAQPRLLLPRPILPRDRSPMDKLIDLIIGDGPNNRYALICRVCCSHNGMALKHDFEYLAFRCAYCMQWNPPKRMKPQAPILPLDFGPENESENTNELKTDGDNLKESADESQAAGEDSNANESLDRQVDLNHSDFDIAHSREDSEENQCHQSDSNCGNEQDESDETVVSSQSENLVEPIESTHIGNVPTRLENDNVSSE